MADRPLYPKVVVGYVENERGEDARVLAERVVERDGGELKVVHVEKGSPADTLQALAERGEADLIVLGSTHHAHVGSVCARKRRRAPAARGSLPPDHRPEGIRARRIIPRIACASSAVGFNGMAESYAALDEAATLAAKFGGSMRVIGGRDAGPGDGGGRRGSGGRRGGTGLPDAARRRRRRAAAGAAGPAGVRARAIRCRSCSRRPRWASTCSCSARAASGR